MVWCHGDVLIFSIFSIFNFWFWFYWQYININPVHADGDIGERKGLIESSSCLDFIRGFENLLSLCCS